MQLFSERLKQVDTYQMPRVPMYLVNQPLYSVNQPRSLSIKWSINTTELCRGEYAIPFMLSKLKYTGVSRKYLLYIYKLFIRSKAEYMSALWHSGLTLEEDRKIEIIQKSSLKIILQEMFIDYDTALEICTLQKLFQRRQSHCLSFAKRCLKNKQTSTMFPINPSYCECLSFIFSQCFLDYLGSSVCGETDFWNFGLI